MLCFFVLRMKKTSHILLDKRQQHIRKCCTCLHATLVNREYRTFSRYRLLYSSFIDCVEQLVKLILHVKCSIR